MNTTSASQFAELKREILLVVQEIRAIEGRIHMIADTTKQLGIHLNPIEDESEVDYLRRLAGFCNTREFELKEQIARSRLNESMAQEPTPLTHKARSWIADALSKGSKALKSASDAVVS